MSSPCRKNERKSLDNPSVSPADAYRRLKDARKAVQQSTKSNVKKQEGMADIEGGRGRKQEKKN